MNFNEELQHLLFSYILLHSGLYGTELRRGLNNGFGIMQAGTHYNMPFDKI